MEKKKWAAWTPELVAEAKFLRSQGLGVRQIAEKLGRTYYATAHQFKLNKTALPPRPPGKKHHRNICSLIARENDPRKYQDLAFQAAMRRAILMGLEKAPVGVYVNKKPFDAIPFQFRGETPLSGAGSSAALCAAMGERGGS